MFMERKKILEKEGNISGSQRKKQRSALNGTCKQVFPREKKTSGQKKKLCRKGRKRGDIGGTPERMKRTSVGPKGEKRGIRTRQGGTGGDGKKLGKKRGEKCVGRFSIRSRVRNWDARGRGLFSKGFAERGSSRGGSVAMGVQISAKVTSPDGGDDLGELRQNLRGGLPGLV